MRDAGFHSHRAAKKGDGLAPSQSIDPHVPTGFEDRILLKLANRGRGVLGLLRSALADPECRVVTEADVGLAGLVERKYGISVRPDRSNLL
jgi:hypothetical protein